MRLVLFRHGIAVDRDDPECPTDPQRPLTKEGAHLTRQAAQGLRALKVAPESILSSPYVRAMETAGLAADVLKIKRSRIEQTDLLLPLHGPQALLDALAMRDEGEILAVGHAPHLDEVVARAVGVSFGSFTALKKAGAALLEIGEGARSASRLVWILPAGTLRRLAKQH